MKIFLVAALALLSLTPASAKDKKKWVIGAWKGVYTYSTVDAAGGPSKLKPVEFELFFIQKGFSLEGHIAEPNTFGRGDAPHLVAGLKGTVTTDGQVEFVKLYDGTADVSHAVTYRGALSLDGRRIKGQWTITGEDGRVSTGNFSMEAIGDL